MGGRYRLCMPSEMAPAAPHDHAARPAEAEQPRPLPAPRVKVCGITTPDDARLARDLGAWAVGMIFYEGSPRRCSRAAARAIAAELRRRTELCGVFVNATMEEIDAAVQELGLTLVQLHGEEGPAFCAEVRRRTGARVIKAAQVADEGDVRDLARFHVDYHLLDSRPRASARRGLRGGTGESFDWTLVAARRSRIPLILSGGLCAENVGEAIRATHPWALDTASGTEAAPGRKDPERMRAFFGALQDAAVAR